MKLRLLVEQECTILDLIKEACLEKQRSKMKKKQTYSCSESLSRFVLCLLTSQGDSFSNKVIFLKFNFGN